MDDAAAPPPGRHGLLGLTYRQVTALIALVNLFVATYLHLWKIGKVGALACGAGGGCHVVQFSPWSWFLGVDVALIGAVGYTLILITALIGSTGGRDDARGPAVALAALIWPAFLFTLRLKYYEFLVLHSFCPWCAISAVSITTLSVLAWLELRRTRSAR
ncbi:MAG: vitamin K epoxide reductase family protein [Gemmatimonadaceae bacterium]|nr:vitamin K epoxide reductase family protein [Gemmatimonadaceae bacterium]